MVDRPDTMSNGSEREMLDVFLDARRATIVLKAEGLGDADAARRLVNSATTVSGVIRHLADVERSWFVEVFADLPYDREFGSDEDPDGEFNVTDQDSLTKIVADYDAACAQSRAAVAKAGLDDVAAHGPMNLRWILLHMIAETARHAGHLDILREQLDGTTGEWPGKVPALAARSGAVVRGRAPADLTRHRRYEHPPARTRRSAPGSSPSPSLA